ncbi:hypothetical protein GUITHDRAFT_109819 [Guillardia theta CCMP2712]|uniref:Uncharacterized protein n=1 Tax=Guillardia theta (strain CCMP2712) TaxID=905079 RepID=L1J8I0_GUITC|nr:hypothetical protein GUITHDRAFT_109819 [Guillardia theta CCMP2712]EKX44370.1 hypothetical protein GUITHDRAFT_109819 [Guillardia theta CCMP2712]|eukprot:XP_005831350.1 hypothetical protein GUITHDRAFT_109819 [Guillardia theta CCMP2712]
MLSIKDLRIVVLCLVFACTTAIKQQHVDNLDVEDITRTQQHQPSTDGAELYHSMKRKFKKFSSLVRLVQKKYGISLSQAASTVKARSLLKRSWEKLQKLQDGYKKAAARRIKKKARKVELQKQAIESSAQQQGRRVSKQEAVFLFTALNPPVQPREVTFPLSEEEFVRLLASREALVETAEQELREGKLTSAAMRKNLMMEADANQRERRDILLQHCSRGRSLHATSIGMALAQFDLLAEEVQEKAIMRARENIDSMPPGGLQNLLEAMAERVLNETRTLSQDATDRAEWFARNYSPPRSSAHPVM